MQSSLLVVLMVVFCAYLCTASYIPKCNPPKAPGYGGYRPKKPSYYIGSKVKFFCRYGYLLSGYRYTYCVYDRKTKQAVWKYDPPVCKGITCPDLKDPVNGKVADGNNRPGTKAIYKCAYGFKLVGSAMRKCLLNGKWSGKALVCKPIFCPKLKDPPYGSVDDGDNRPGTVAVYKCDKEFALVGVPKRKCQANGQWTGKAPVCKRTGCGIPPKPRYGSVRYKSTSFGSRAYYRCDFGYYLSGNRHRTCTKKGNWSGRTPSCRRHRKHLYHG